MFLQSRSQDEGSTASAYVGHHRKCKQVQGRRAQQGRRPSRGKQLAGESHLPAVVSGASAGGLGVMPPAVAVTLLGHFVRAAGLGWGRVHESPGVDWRKSPQEVSNMPYLGEGGTHNISLFDWR